MREEDDEGKDLMRDVDEKHIQKLDEEHLS